MQLVVDVNEKLLKEFRAFAAEKHGRLYNALKPEVEKALRGHLDGEKGKSSSSDVKSPLKSPHVDSEKPESGDR